MRHSKVSPFLMSKYPHNATCDESPQIEHIYNPQLDHLGGWSRRGHEFLDARRAFLNSYHLNLERKNNGSFKEKLKKSMKEANEAAVGVVLGMRRGMSKRRVGIRVFRVKMTSQSWVLVTIRCFIPWLNKREIIRKRRINMKIQCDVCEKAPATVICCADEAALCAKCDVEVHAANKLASKHQRLLLQCLSNKLPKCDICQDKAAFIFCVEDRALFCQDCDEPIHSAGSLTANHQRFLATGIQVALSSSNCTKDNEKSYLEPPNRNPQQVPMKVPSQQAPSFTSSWAVDDLLELSGFESPEKKESLQFGELEWLEDMGLFGEQFTQEALAAAEVPQLPVTHNSSNVASSRTSKSYMSYKKPRIEVLNDDDDEYFTVPDLG
ncbi:hypothetical protein VNO77_29141 [Canavalia gladiata]|uniref:B box-type domain-containing protein n=1 Tax=Canavalia gladiata TaxID=3824 RepID=A0AAN9KW97_CANGL